MGIKVDPNNYLEGNYDGENIAEQALQVAQDVAEASKIAKEVERMYKEYEQREDILKYLTDGATLMCDQACLTTFTMKDGTTIKIKYSKEEEAKGDVEKNKRLYTKLHVKDTKMLSGPALQATTVDSKKYENIPPFKCNCNLMDDRQKETDAIYKYLNSQKSREKNSEGNIYVEGGVCQCLMELNDRWENLPREEDDFYDTRSVVMESETETGEKEEVIESVPCITMTSALFCKHGGLITPYKPGQKKTVTITWETVTQLGDWGADRFYLARYITELMKAEGYPSEIIAGIVGNVVNEGDFGKFEGYDSKSSYRYIHHMEEYHDYENIASNKYLFELGMQIFEKLEITDECRWESDKHKYGLGFVQWTASRCDDLVGRYKSRFSMTECPTKFQCQEVEINFMLEELAGDYKSVMEECYGKIEEFGANETAVDSITKIIMEKYEVAGVENLEDRKKDARLWYGVLTKPTYVVIGEDQDV